MVWSTSEVVVITTPVVLTVGISPSLVVVRTPTPVVDATPVLLVGGTPPIEVKLAKLPDITEANQTRSKARGLVDETGQEVSGLLVEDVSGITEVVVPDEGSTVGPVVEGFTDPPEVEGSPTMEVVWVPADVLPTTVVLGTGTVALDDGIVEPLVEGLGPPPEEEAEEEDAVNDTDSLDEGVEVSVWEGSKLTDVSAVCDAVADVAGVVATRVEENREVVPVLTGRVVDVVGCSSGGVRP